MSTRSSAIGSAVAALLLPAFAVMSACGSTATTFVSPSGSSTGNGSSFVGANGSTTVIGGNGSTTVSSGGSTTILSGSGGSSASVTTGSNGSTTTITTTSNTGSSAASTTATGVSSTCIVGQQGCLCDTMGMCAPGLTCTPQTAPSPSLCCMGTNCTSTTMSIGASCGTTTGAVSCGTPGVTTLTGSGTNDGCGYPTANFNESTTLCGIVASGGGATPAIIEAFYTDEHALPLGCGSNGATVTPFPGPAPAAAYYPSTGDPTCVDSQGRPIRPVLYITDITSDATCKAGDQQMMGTPYDPIAVFGTWKTGGSGTNAGPDPSTLNYWNLGSSADMVPQSVITACPCTMAGDPGCNVSRMGKGYSAELKFEAGLISGHSYRLQVMLHDGDQSQGGDSGEGCATFCAGTGSSCGELPPCATGCPTGSTCNASSGCCQ